MGVNRMKSNVRMEYTAADAIVNELKRGGVDLF